MSTAHASQNLDSEQFPEASRTTSSCSTSTLVGTPRTPSKARLPPWQQHASQDEPHLPPWRAYATHDKELPSYQDASKHNDDDHDIEKQCEEQRGEHHKPNGHPIAHIYPNHHGFAIFLSLTLLLTLAHVTMAISFRIFCYTPITEDSLDGHPQTHNACTHNMNKWTRAFVNRQPWQFCFAIIWMVIIWGFQWIWDRANMRSGWKYPVQALVPLLFNAGLGTFFFSAIGYVLMAEGVRPIVATAAGEQASGF